MGIAYSNENIGPRKGHLDLDMVEMRLEEKSSVIKLASSYQCRVNHVISIELTATRNARPVVLPIPRQGYMKCKRKSRQRQGQLQREFYL